MPLLTFVSLCCIVAYLAAYRRLFADSFLGFSVRNRQLSGLIFLFYTSVFVLPALVLVPLLGPDAIRTLSHFVQTDTVHGAVLWAWYALFAFGLTFWLVRAALGRSVGYDGHRVLAALENPQTRFRLLIFTRLLALGIVLLLSYAVVVQGAKHAFFYGLLQNIAPGALRHGNAGISGLSYVKHYISVSCILMAVQLACPVYRNRRVERLVLFAVLVVGSTFYGSKSPLIMYLIAYVFASIETRPRLSLPVMMRRLAMGAGLLLAILMVIVIFAGEKGFDLAVFLDYLWNRLFIGQMAGYFEQWNLLLWREDYILHAIPFASLFQDYPVFHKDLMLISEGRLEGSQIGIKITFYMAEAYAMLGWAGFVLSPFIMAVQFMVTFLIFAAVLRKLVYGNPALARFTAAYFFVTFFSTTDGLSEMLFYKGLIVLLIIITPASLATWFLAGIATRRRRFSGYAGVTAGWHL